MNRFFVLTAAILGALSVTFGAFAAHQLKTLLTAETVAVFETGVRYQFYHALALLVLGLNFEKLAAAWVRRAGYFFIAGIVLFSGSLYTITFLKYIENENAIKYAGIITPFGGLCFIAGWLLVFVATAKRR